MSPHLHELPVIEAIDVTITRIRTLASHPGFSALDAKAIAGTLGAYKFLKTKHATDGRMQATPVGDREDVSCPGN